MPRTPSASSGSSGSSRGARSASRLAVALALAGCATLAPPERGVYVAAEVAVRGPGGAAPALALVGDIGVDRGEDSERLARAIARRLAGAPGAAVLVLGDVLYAGSGSPEARIEAVLEPYRRALPGHPLIALGGNHDAGAAEREAVCAGLPIARPGWRFVARGCGLDREEPVGTFRAGGAVVFAVDSEAMIGDAEFRRASLDGLRTALVRVRESDPHAWRLVATHHPLETYGAHDGASLRGALYKDLWLLRQTLLYPVFWLLEQHVGQQDVYEPRYRAFRRDLYALFRDEPVDLVASGHDHSLQHVSIEHAGVRHQIVSGAGAQSSPVKRWGHDLLWTNRLARRLGAADSLPAHRHTLRFGWGGGYGFAVLIPESARLVVEFWDAAGEAPLHVTEISRAGDAR